MTTSMMRKNLSLELTRAHDLVKELRVSSPDAALHLLKKIIIIQNHSISIIEHALSELAKESRVEAHALEEKFSKRRRLRQEDRSKQVEVLGEADPDDGFRWRKYGQKNIKGSSHPRSYYRCKNGGCLAVKTVQRSDRDPLVVEVTHGGGHTCIASSDGSLPMVKPVAAAPKSDSLPLDVYNPGSFDHLQNNCEGLELPSGIIISDLMALDTCDGSGFEVPPNDCGVETELPFEAIGVDWMPLEHCNPSSWELPSSEYGDGLGAAEERLEFDLAAIGNYIASDNNFQDIDGLLSLQELQYLLKDL